MKRILKSLIVIGAVLIALGAGTFAWFSDTETSTGNTFTAGTLDIQVRDDGIVDPDPWGDGVDLTWVMDNMIPGISTVTNTVTLRNVGSIPGDHVEISFNNAIDELTNPVESDTNPNSNPEDLTKWIEITSMIYDSVDLKTNIENTIGYDVNNNGWLDLDDVARSVPVIAEGGPLDNLPTPTDVGGEATLSMSLKFRAEATNDIQGDILITTVTFTLNQDSTQ